MSESTSPSAAAQDQELARLRAELQLTQQQLAAARAGLEDFAYTVSHDLRANLRHINAYIGLVREELGDRLDASAAGYMDTVSDAAQLMGRQIDGLMALSQLDRATLQETTLDLKALIEEVRASLAAQTAGRQIEWQVADDFPAVRADAALVRQVLGHLLGNAIKFTRPRSVAQVQIGWEGQPDAKDCTLFVRDNGVGFNPRMVDKLFRVFQRLHSASDFEGLGMGLALTRKIVALHGGTVQAEGAPDAGCRISFTLPRAQQDAVAAP